MSGRLRSGFVKPPKEKMEDIRGKKLVQMQFPSDIGAYGFVINFQEYQYQPDSPNDPLKIKTKESILLPIPTNLGQQYSATIKEERLGVVGQAVALSFSEVDRAVDNAKTGFMKGTGNVISQLATTAGVGEEISLNKDDVGDVAGLLRGAAQIPAIARRGILPEFALTAVEAGFGNIYNPNNIAAFKGNPVRTHDLNWKLIPRNKKESETLNKIVKTIRHKMHSSLEGIGEGTAGTFVQNYPDVIQCALITPDINNSIFYKPGLISDFTVEHAGKGDLNFFNDTGSPVNYDVKIKFTELDFITRRDFEDIDKKENPSNTNKTSSS
tara:strand:- start:817 stop:1791 length:975 start_codon:yes stop_codon:yes gene_type:complete